MTALNRHPFAWMISSDDDECFIASSWKSIFSLLIRMQRHVVISKVTREIQFADSSRAKSEGNSTSPENTIGSFFAPNLYVHTHMGVFITLTKIFCSLSGEKRTSEFFAPYSCASAVNRDARKECRLIYWRSLLRRRHTFSFTYAIVTDVLTKTRLQLIVARSCM